ncbi:CotO family spore coat protein [Siminovitchia fortis]|uniref:Uncharacterized protein n=1 Tax=Siminovitchia fortis TaxID=254758 RepID=A0A443IL63_9BACI|nr:CotO family spore coat protein [Siminovitchia fortis]RWR05546.1 hypothetical protein D4N35_015390 [Siminovitchia fortis]WHY83545.1 CotO family spore coat protein [Siminovitchia fortis]
MKEKGRKKPQKPLLFIEQPSLKEPNHRMQSQYRSSTGPPAAFNSNFKDSVAVDRHQTKKRKVSFGEEKFIFEEEEVGEKIGEKQVEENKPVSAVDYFRFHAHNSNRPARGGLNPVKSFTSMTIEEKLHHLSSKPQFYSCTFSTPLGGVKGKLYAADKEKIVVKADSGELATIEKKDLLGIRINA